MYGLEWKEQRGIEGIGFVRALRSLLTAHLPSLLPTLRSMIEEAVDKELMGFQCRNGNYLAREISTLDDQGSF